MENLVFTQLSIPEVRQLFREEFVTVFSSLSDNAKEELKNHPVTKELTCTRKGRGKRVCSNQVKAGA